MSVCPQSEGGTWYLVSGTCSFPGGAPGLWCLVLSFPGDTPMRPVAEEGYPVRSVAWGYPQTGQGTSAAQNKDGCTGSMPLAFTQEDFFVYFLWHVRLVGLLVVSIPDPPPYNYVTHYIQSGFCRPETLECNHLWNVEVPSSTILIIKGHFFLNVLFAFLNVLLAFDVNIVKRSRAGVAEWFTVPCLRHGQ